MFKFDFQLREDVNDAAAFKEKHSEENCTKEIGSLFFQEAHEIFCTTDVIDNLDIARLNAKELILGHIKIIHLVAGYVLDNIKDHETHLDISKAEEQRTDLISGLYEGGAKIWECTDDLLKFLIDSIPSKKWSGKLVLDLGCGSGLLGIFAKKYGALVHFQDYNEDVLRKITIPNVLLNFDHLNLSKNHDEFLKEMTKNVHFYSGDWSKYTMLTMNERKFDIILTSETIYNPQNHKKLLETFSQRLDPKGIVLLAAKTYYFGVGGGLRQFEKLIADDGRFVSKVLWCSAEGVNREIIEIKFKLQEYLCSPYN